MELVQLALVGFAAQLIDGALGMAYGVTCTSSLLALGFTPASASASVHAAELLTSGISGHFHWRLGNVDADLFRRLVWPGMAGGAIGAFTVATVSADTIRPFVALYLAAMALRILSRAWRKAPRARLEYPIGPLGFVGGCLDAIGGGGWGPIVTSTLIGHGREPRFAIGSVNRAEFFVTLAQVTTFVTTIGITQWSTVAALCVGGACAAPLAAVMAKRTRAETLMVIVGLIILTLSMLTLLRSF